MISVTDGSASSGSSTPRPIASSMTWRIRRVRSEVESTGPSRRDHAADDALQARAALRAGELGELGEVDLLEQPAAVEGHAVAVRVVLPSPWEAMRSLSPISRGGSRRGRR